MNPHTSEIPYVPHPAVPDFAQPAYRHGTGNGQVRHCTRRPASVSWPHAIIVA